MNYKLLILPILAGSLIATGCANRKPATNTTVTNGTGSVSGATTSGLGTDSSISAQGGSTLGVTDANRPFLGKRVVHFDYDSSDVSNEDYQTLQAHAQYLSANANSKVALVGHTDERGTREYNMALGERRAKAVESFLTSYGVRADQLEAVSYGKEQPVNAGHNEAAWSENRRVEINYEAVPPILTVPNSR